jgi:hypothetical protein
MGNYMERPYAQALLACLVPPKALEEASESVGHRRRQREKILKKKKRKL